MWLFTYRGFPWLYLLSIFLLFQRVTMLLKRAEDARGPTFEQKTWVRFRMAAARGPSVP